MTPLTEVNGVGPILSRLLAQLGIASVADLSSAKAETLVALPGVGLRRAEGLIDAARDLTQSPDYGPAQTGVALDEPAHKEARAAVIDEPVESDKKAKKKKAKKADAEKPAKSGKKKKKKGGGKSDKKA